MQDFLISFDLDWAPDFVLEKTLSILNNYNLPTTFFITHHSDALKKFKVTHDYIEIGLHPDLTLHSQQGSNLFDVKKFFMLSNTEPLIIRSHGNVVSTNLYSELFSLFGPYIDSSIFLPRNLTVSPSQFWHSNSLVKLIPYIWEDSHELHSEFPIFFMNNDFWQNILGISVLNFHPIHIYIDQIDPAIYRSCKNIFGPISKWKKNDIDNYLGYHGESKQGPVSTFLREALDFKSKNFPFSTFRQFN